MDAPNLRIKVKDFLKLFTSGHETVVILDEQNQSLYHGVVGSFLRDGRNREYREIKECYVHHISGDDYNRVLIWIVKDITIFRYIRDFEKQHMMLIDLLQYIIDEERIIICTKKGEVYNGSREKFLKTPNGMLNKHCYDEVESFESGVIEEEPVTYIYLNERKVKNG